MKHALVIGGTGMLSDVSLWLVKVGYHVSVIGRDEERLKQLRSRVQDSTCITPIAVDYHQEESLREQIRTTVAKNGPLELVVAWIHSPFNNVLKIINREMTNGDLCAVYHVIGSRTNASKVRADLNLAVSCNYLQVQLGFVIEGQNSRWLSHQEISNGVMEAIKLEKQYHLVGVLEPESKRPL